jgi:recombination protein RecA
MSSASAIRLQIEAALAHRIPSALTPVAKAIRPVLPTGVTAVDELLAGGLPVGAISEFVGPESSGRTSLALAFLARNTQAGRVGAWIDVEDAFDPESAAAAGVDLTRLLWVRCGLPARRAQSPGENHFRVPENLLVPPAVIKGLHGGGFGPHPRTEIKGLAGAVSELLRHESRADSQPEMRLESEIAREMEREIEGEMVRPVAPLPVRNENRRRPGKPWARIEQALRVADLLLQAGGFAAVVLDMAGIAPEYATRVPMATWFRYRAAAERTQASLLLLTQHSCAKSSAELLLRFAPGQPRRDETTVFTGMEHGVEVERRRFTQTAANVVPLRKPPQRELKPRESGAHWRSQSPWAGKR